MDKVKRKLWVCAQKNCAECRIGTRHIPEDCGYALCHVLDTNVSGIKVVPRRSGKTTTIISKASEMADSGYNVVVLVPTHSMVHHMQKLMMGSGVHIISVGDKQVALSLAGLPHGAVFSDEVGDYIAKEVEQAGHQFVLGFRS